MESAVNIDHVGIRVTDLAFEIEKWRALGFDVSETGGSMAIIQLAQGVRLALLGPGVSDPHHIALRTHDAGQFDKWASAEKASVVHHADGGKRFFAQGGKGLALEIIWNPPAGKVNIGGKGAYEI